MKTGVKVTPRFLASGTRKNEVIVLLVWTSLGKEQVNVLMCGWEEMSDHQKMVFGQVRFDTTMSHLRKKQHECSSL